MNLQEAITEIEKRLAKAKEHLAVSYVEKQISDWRGRVEVLTEVLGILKQVEPEISQAQFKTAMSIVSPIVDFTDPKTGMRITNFSGEPTVIGTIAQDGSIQPPEVPRKSRPQRTLGQ